MRAVSEAKEQALLEVRDLVKHYLQAGPFVRRKRASVVKAVDGVSFSIAKGETLALVGESGCGKSTTARCILRLIEPTSGNVWFDGDDILRFDHKKLRRWRREAQIIFQDPYASLNPRMRVSEIVAEPLRVSGLFVEYGGIRRVHELLEMVGLRSDYGKRYPHEVSGGERQRIAIARALALNPRLIVCDEPVTALDVSIRSQIINLLRDLQGELGLTYLFIAHDLAVVRQICDRVAVMYLGKIVEVARSGDFYGCPRHPYARSLLSAAPIPDPRKELERRRIVLIGDVPSPANPPSGCRFHPRCYKRQEICGITEPLMDEKGDDHLAACFFPEEIPSTIG